MVYQPKTIVFRRYGIPAPYVRGYPDNQTRMHQAVIPYMTRNEVKAYIQRRICKSGSQWVVFAAAIPDCIWMFRSRTMAAAFMGKLAIALMRAAGNRPP